MRIFVDADACPVKKTIIEIGEKYSIPVYLVLSLSHYSPQDKKVETILIDNIPEAVDIAISNRVVRGDIVITQDYGLASMLISKGCIVLHHTGKRFTKDNIDELIFKRHLASKVRRSGGKIKGPKAFTEKDKNRFKISLEKVIEGYKQE